MNKLNIGGLMHVIIVFTIFFFIDNFRIAVMPITDCTNSTLITRAEVSRLSLCNGFL